MRIRFSEKLFEELEEQFDRFSKSTAMRMFILQSDPFRKILVGQDFPLWVRPDNGKISNMIVNFYQTLF